MFLVEVTLLLVASFISTVIALALELSLQSKAIMPSSATSD